MLAKACDEKSGKPEFQFCTNQLLRPRVSQLASLGHRFLTGKGPSDAILQNQF